MSRKILLQCTVIALAVFCMIYGIGRGEAKTVLNKAINICFECIGLG